MPFRIPYRWFLRWRLLKRLPPLDSVGCVLVMCTANRVRSPFAEAMLRRHLPPGVQVLSRGVLAGGGRCPGEAIEAAGLYEVDLSQHRARQLAVDELLRADLVLTMELRMAHDLVTRYPAVGGKVALLSAFDPDGGMTDVEDPYMLPPAEYEASYETIARCCEELGARLAAHRAGDPR